MPGRTRTACPYLHDQPLPAWLVWWLPIALTAYPLALTLPALNWEAGLDREQGLLENLTALLLLAALVLFLRSFSASRGTGLWRIWLLGLACGAFFFLGEEVSWGQHYFGWQTPEPLRSLNRQGEVNLHNLRGIAGELLGHGCSAALSLAVALGGLGGLLARLPGARLQHFFAPWLLPPLGCAPVAALSVLVRLPRLMVEDPGTLPLFYGQAMGELKECLQALFILLYAIAQLRLTAACCFQEDAAACAG
ncbi:MAG: hypothetical protein LDL31_03965 [Prosthecobacter sp.]|nr:hypothetical protein [Prosthecobacter sp.]